MHRLRAIALASLCCAIVAVVAACGSSSQVQANYGSLANQICRTWTAAAQTNPSTTQRLQAIETALAGLQKLHPPHNAVEPVYVHLLYHFKAAVDILKPNMQTLTRLARRLQTNPGDKRAARRYAALGGYRITRHLRLAAADAHRLGMGSCQIAFSG